MGQDTFNTKKPALKKASRDLHEKEIPTFRCGYTGVITIYSSVGRMAKNSGGASTLVSYYQVLICKRDVLYSMAYRIRKRYACMCTLVTRFKAVWWP